MKTNKFSTTTTFDVFNNAKLSKLEQKEVKGGVIVVDIIAP
ncbi:MAG: hypothetical protein R2828_33870 [Saprospiraceae bacterium]